MSDPHPHEENHEGPIRTPKQLIWTVIASFVLPVFIIILLVNYVASGGRPGAGADAQSPQAVAERLQPVGRIALKDSSAPAVVRTGEQVYQQQCTACHAAGAAGAPKSGDTAAWAPRIATGFAALLNSAAKGKGAMAAQVTPDTSEYEVARAVVYMANAAGAKFEEPKAPAPPAAAASEPAK